MEKALYFHEIGPSGILLDGVPATGRKLAGHRKFHGIKHSETDNFPIGY
jgi:hypothetical protein